MKRLLILFVIVINCTLVATAQENVAENDMKRFQDAVASADTLKIRSLQKEYLANIEFYSNGASKDEDAYLFYNLMSGLSHLSIAECKEAIPYYTIAYEGYSKQRLHTSVEEKSLSELTGSLGICHAYSQNSREAVHYASLSVKHAQKSKMDSQVTLSRFWLAQVYYQIGQYPKAYKTIRQIKTKVEDNLSYQSFPEIYADILNEMSKLAINNNQFSRIKEYYNELNYILKQYPESNAANVVGDKFAIELVIYALKRDISMADELISELLRSEYIGHCKYIEKKKQKSWETYYSDRCCALAKVADNEQKGSVSLYLMEQIFKLDKSQLTTEEWSMGMLWVAYYQVKYKDAYKRAIDLLYNTLLANRNSLSPQNVKDLIWQMLHTVHRALFHIRSFSNIAIGEKFTDNYCPVLSPDDSLYIITKWSEILDYLTSEYGEKYINNILSSFDSGLSRLNARLNVIGYSQQDMQRFLAEYYIYYQQYDKFDEVFYQLVNTCNLTTEQQLLLFYINSEDLYLNKEATHAYSFLNHIKNSTRYSTNPEISKWVEQRIKDLDNWISNTVSHAQQCTLDGKLEDAIYWYDAVLKHIEKNKGRKAEYAEILTFKAGDLYFSKQYNGSLKSAKEALDIIKTYKPNDFYDRYTALKTMYKCYGSQNEYANAVPYMQEALDLLKHKYQDNEYYKRVEEIVYTYYDLLSAYDKLNNNEKLSSIAKDATQYIVKNNKEIKGSAFETVATSIVEYLIKYYINNGEKAALQNNYNDCLSSYNDAVELLEYGIWGYHHIYYNDNVLFLEYLLKASHTIDIERFYKIVEDYWKYTEEDLKYSISNGIALRDQISQMASENYERLANICYNAGLWSGAIHIYSKLLNYLDEHNIIDDTRIAEIYLSMSNCHRGLKDYCGSLECRERSLQHTINKNGHKHSATFECFHGIKTMYNVCSGYVLRVLTGDANTAGHYNTYEADNNFFTLWYKLQYNLSAMYGEDYLQELYDYCKIAFREWAKQNNKTLMPPSPDSDLDWKSKMMYDKIYLSILYNRIDEAWESYEALCGYIGYVKVVPYTIEIARVLAENGYYDHAMYMLELNVYSIPVDAGIDVLNSTAEKIFVEIASIARSYNRADVLIGALAVIEKQISIIHSTKEKNLAQLVCWYDSGTIVEALSMLTEAYMILDRSKGENYARILENIVSDNIVGKNGIRLTSASMSDVYNTLSLVATDYNKKVEYLIKAIRHSIRWNYVYHINLLEAYSVLGQYEQADKLLPQITDFVRANYLHDSWKSTIFQCTTLNAIWKKDSSTAKIESKKRLDTIIKMYLQKSQMLTNSSRAALWDYSFGSTLQWFSMVDLLNDRDATVSYDAALFHKNILLTQHAMIDKNIRACNDSELKVAHNEYLVAVRNQTDSIEMLESRMMQLYAKHPEFVDTYKPLSWKDVQTRLSKKEVAIEFALTEKNATSPAMFVALLLQHNAQNPIVVPLCNYDDLKNLIDKYTDSQTGYANIYDIPDNSLYQLLWSPLQDYLKGVKNIYFAPYDLLNNINFSAIRFEDTKKCIGDMYSLHRLSSTAKLCESASDDTYKKMVAFGGIDYNNYDSLVNTTQSVHKNSNSDDSYSDVRGLVEEWNTLDKTKPEVQHIQSALTKSDIAIQVHTDTNASEEQFKKLSGDSVNIIHLATHGYYFKANDAKKMLFFNNPNREIPMNIDSGARSGLILSGGNIAWKGETPAGREDGVLTAKEILGMDLSSADLVVLSACQTALGDIRNDGIYGMQRNIKMAGAKSMIMSLWQVSDEATEIMMTAFYRNLSHGNSKKQAFNKAVTKVRKAYQKKYQKGKDSQKHRDIGSIARYDSSYYWAAFVLLD